MKIKIVLHVKAQNSYIKLILSHKKMFHMKPMKYYSLGPTIVLTIAYK